jgi:energy-coupling factor transport system ATP-binding protein
MENYRKAFPYKLSGGQKQRVGIGSTMALRPQAIILDEPTSELDPVGRYEVLSVIRELKEQNLSIIIVEHNTEELMNFVDRIIVLNDGEILMDDETSKVFREVEMLRSIGVRPPDSVEFLDRLFKLGLISQLYDSFDEQSLINNLVDNVRKAKQ